MKEKMRYVPGKTNSAILNPFSKLFSVFILVAMCLGPFTLSAGESPFFLVKNGKTDLVIVQEKNPPKSLTAALESFTKLVKKSTGAEIPCAEKPQPGKKHIVLIREERPVDDLDRFTISFPDANTMRITGSAESIAFALDYLLENAFNIRRLVMHYSDWYWKNRPARVDRDLEVSCEKVSNASIPRKTVTQKASFNFKRHLYTHLLGGWKTRFAFPGVHDITKWAFPASKYAPKNTWPQEILPVIGGKRFVMPITGPNRRTWGVYQARWQPCWSNPASVKIAVENILEQIKIQSRKAPVYSINLDVNDNGGCCQCAECMKHVPKQRSCIGSVNYSNLYWKWINEIAKEVTKVYPGVYFNCLAYREVIEPPDFKLHPNVIPQICRELTASLDPNVKPQIENLFKAWSKKASVIFLWDYEYGTTRYLFPRVYFHRQAELFRMVYRYHVRGVFTECWDCTGLEGPKHYLNAKLFWDINTDVDQAIREWCEAAVGKKAAPYLEKYFLFWEEYFQRKEIMATNWFSSAPATYMQLREQGTYTYALRRGEMAKLRALMEKALSLCETEQQKKRMAFYLNENFAMVEASAACLYSEYLQPDGTVASLDDAIALLESVPRAVKSMLWLKNSSLLDPSLISVVEGGLTSNINAVMPYAKNPKVKGLLQKYAADQTFPKALQTQFQIFAGKKFENLFKDGSFEEPSPLPPGSPHRDFRRFTHGKSSLRFRNTTVTLTCPGAKPGKTYYFALDVCANKVSAEGRFSIWTAPRAGKRNMDWKRLSNLKLKKGWQTISFAYQVPKNNPNIDNFLFYVRGHLFENDEVLWIDNFRIYQLD